MNCSEPRRSALLEAFVSYETLELETATAAAQYVVEKQFAQTWDFALMAKDEVGRPARAAANWIDALILDAARQRDLVLVTADQALADTAEKHGAQVLRLS